MNLQSDISEKNTFYPDISERFISRLLSQGDFNPFSKTFGCFDRNYWHYRTVTDFPSAIFQQASLSLALLFVIDHPRNIFFSKPEVLTQAEAAIDFWTKLQHNDGSFDEWFPFERSHVATAFTSYAISEALILIGDKISARSLENTVISLRKATLWLADNFDPLVANHNAGALAALCNVYKITGDTALKRDINAYISLLEKQQDKEGWFSEYGGADPGYASLSLDYIAKAYIASSDKRLIPIIEKALNFVSDFLHPDNSFGGLYGARNTKYLMPHGLELLAPHFDSAKSLLKPFRNVSLFDNLAGPLTADDRFLIFFFAPNYLQAWKDSFHIDDLSDNLVSGQQEKIYMNAGLAINRSDMQHSIVGISKGGIVKVFFKNGSWSEIYADSGYVIEDEMGDVFSTQWLESIPKFVKQNIYRLQIERNFAVAKTSPKRNFLLAFRVFNLTLGKAGKLSKFISDLVKKRYIVRKKINKNYTLKRDIVISEKSFEINDEITWIKSPARLALLKEVSLLHVPSSRIQAGGSIKSVNFGLSSSQIKGSKGIVVNIFSENGAVPTIEWSLKTK